MAELGLIQSGGKASGPIYKTFLFVLQEVSGLDCNEAFILQPSAFSRYNTLDTFGHFRPTGLYGELRDSTFSSRTLQAPTLPSAQLAEG